MHRIQGSADSTVNSASSSLRFYWCCLVQDVENVINSRRRKRAVPLDLIKFVLYGKLACLPLNVRQTNSQLQVNDPLWSLQQLVDGTADGPSRPLQSLPRQVGFCRSTIPAAQDKIGVYAKEKIEVGTWMGPYEGRRVALPDGVHFAKQDRRYSWEVYDGGAVLGFIDSEDVAYANWMRYVQTARHSHEQNLDVVQKGEEIYYRVMKPIDVGAELLVWYGAQHDRHFDVPCGLSNQYTREDGHSESTEEIVRQKSDLENAESPNSPRRPCVTAPVADVTETTSLGCEAWQCGQCFRTFSQRTLLQLHVCYGQPNKPFRCGHCRLSFGNPDELKSHVFSHSSEKPFRCGFCHRAFAGSTTLNNHIRTHTNVKPFSCRHCGKEFTQGTQYSRHIKLRECERSRVGDDASDESEFGQGAGRALSEHSQSVSGEDEHARASPTPVEDKLFRV
eukprot:m.121695 g.121695  ORF g.121695 m.121695 type:complete len:448 (+) comp37757_c0_seq18:3435-4778(+)